MFSITKKFLLMTLASVAILGAAGTVAQAQGFRNWSGRDRSSRDFHGSRNHDYVDRLASRLEREARQLNREVDAHFRWSPDYRQFESYVDEIARLANHVHDVAHRGGSLAHLHGDVERLDRLFHSAERLFDRMAGFRRVNYETVVHVKRALNAVERSLHALRDAIH